MGPGGDPATAKLVMFGGATALEGTSRGDSASPGTPGPSSGAGIRLAGATNDIHVFDVAAGLWEKITPDGEVSLLHIINFIVLFSVVSGGKRAGMRRAPVSSPLFLPLGGHIDVSEPRFLY